MMASVSGVGVRVIVEVAVGVGVKVIVGVWVADGTGDCVLVAISQLVGRTSTCVAGAPAMQPEVSRRMPKRKIKADLIGKPSR